MKLAIVALGLAATLLAATERIYVANSGGDDIHIIDPATNQVTGTIQVSDHPHGLVVSPDRTRLYVSSEGEDVLDVVDLATRTVIRRVPLGTRPNNLAITPDGRRVYVTIRGESWVEIVDTETLEVVKKVPVGRAPHNVYCTPNGKWMIATSMGDDRLTAIDIKTEEPAFEIPLPGQPRPLVIDAETRRLYVQLSDLHGFIVVDLASRKVVDKVMLPDAPAGAQPLIPRTFSHGIGIAPDRRSLWVTSLLDHSVSVYSLPDLKRLGTTKTGDSPDWMTFNGDGTRCYVSNAGADSVSVLDVASRKELTQIRVGAMPKRIIAIDRPPAPR
jgi:YVTN family beta-propeller protein